MLQVDVSSSWEEWLTQRNCEWHWIKEEFDLGPTTKVEWYSGIEIDDEDATAFLLKFKL